MFVLSHCKIIAITYTGIMNSIRVDIPLDHGLDLQTYLVAHPAATFFMRAKGISSLAEGVLHNDLLIVDRSLCPKCGSLVIAIVDGELHIKRFNPQFEYEIWGVVTYAIHDVRVN